MLKNLRFYLKVLGGWLLLTNAGHTFGGVTELMSQTLDSSSDNYLAFSAMAAPPKGGFFDYNILEIFFLGMLAIALLLLYSAIVSLWIAFKGKRETLSQFVLLNFVFWIFALGASVLFYPVDNMVVIALGAFLLSALAFGCERAAD